MNQNHYSDERVKAGIVIRAIFGVLLLINGLVSESEVFSILFYIGFALMVLATIYDTVKYRKRNNKER